MFEFVLNNIFLKLSIEDIILFYGKKSFLENVNFFKVLIKLWMFCGREFSLGW